SRRFIWQTTRYASSTAARGPAPSHACSSTAGTNRGNGAPSAHRATSSRHPWTPCSTRSSTGCAREQKIMKAHIVVLPGDGIGPEITVEARLVLEAVAKQGGHEFTFEE